MSEAEYKNKAEYKNILIIKPSALGDIIHALPALSSLRASFPDARITWVVRPEFASVFENEPRVDDLIIFDRKVLGKWYRSWRAFKELMSFFSRLREGRYDLVVDFQGLFRTGLFAFITGSVNRVGPGSRREFSHWFYNKRPSVKDGSLHVIEHNAEIITAAGAEKIVYDYNLSSTGRADVFVDELLDSRGLERDKFAAFIIGSARQNKCWPIERFALLAESLMEEFGLPSVVVGTSKEKEQSKRLCELADCRVLDLTGETSLQELISVLSKSRITVSNDTGPGHISVAVGTATVLIFGPTNPARVGPYRDPNGVVVAVEPDNRGNVIDNYNPRYCIENVSLDMVLGVVREKLGSMNI